MSMVSLNEQLKMQNLVCPRTHIPLRRVDNYLETVDGKNRYDLIGEVPVLFADILTQQEYLTENSGQMNEEYATHSNSVTNFLHGFLAKDFKNKLAVNAFDFIFNNLPKDSLCIAIGGGPRRHHEKLINLNIGAFKNVDIVADAYSLPYTNNSVDAVYIEAVLEHLEFPEVAVKEIFRVLKEGGQVYADTPFMQDFHGYPNHFQNFTIEGHRRLFSRNGFTIKDSGTSVGPTFALFSLITHYIKHYSYSSIIRYPFLTVTYVLSMLFKPLDLKLNGKHASQLLASSTFIYAVK